MGKTYRSKNRKHYYGKLPGLHAPERERTVSFKRKRFEGYVFSCNKEGCGAQLTVPANNFKNAWAAAKKQGWVTGKVGVVWLHWCDWVHKPNEAFHHLHRQYGADH